MTNCQYCTYCTMQVTEIFTSSYRQVLYSCTVNLSSGLFSEDQRCVVLREHCKQFVDKKSTEVMTTDLNTVNKTIQNTSKDLVRYTCTVCNVGYSKRKGDLRTICPICEVKQLPKCPMCQVQLKSLDHPKGLCTACTSLLKQYQENRSTSSNIKPKLGQRKVMVQRED